MPEDARRSVGGSRLLRFVTSAVARMGLAVLVGSVLAVAEAPSAFAHASISATQPAGGEVLSRAPESVVLRFTEAVEATLGGVRVFDSAGERVKTGAPFHPRSDDRRVEVALPRLDDGSYVVTWRVVSADAHPVGGAFTFSIGSGADSSKAAGLSRELLDSQAGSRAVGIAYGTTRTGVLLGIIVLVGGLGCVTFLWPAGRHDRRARRVIWLGWAVTLLGTIGGIAVSGPYDAGLPIGEALRPALWNDVVRTPFGAIWLARALVLLLGVPLLKALLGRGDGASSLSPAPRVTSASKVLSACIGLFLVATPALSGHARSGGTPLLNVAIDSLHVSAVSVWIGGLAMLAIAATRVHTTDQTALAVFARRHSRVALVAVQVAVVTGVLRAVREVGSFDRLFDTTYGRQLSIKLAVFVALIGSAVLARSALGRSTNGDLAHPRRFVRSVKIEVASAVIVVLATGALVGSAPGRTAPTGTFVTTIDDAPLVFDISVSPARRGFNELHVTITDQDATPVDVVSVAVALDLPSKEIEPIQVSMLSITGSHFVSRTLEVPFPGRWRLTVTARISDFDQVVVTDAVDIG